MLASRLSEDPTITVLLLEQGPVADTWASRVPLISGNPYRSGTLARTWWSLPMPDADNRCLEVMRGEALGGTSRINCMYYTRGASRRRFCDLAEAVLLIRCARDSGGLQLLEGARKLRLGI